MNILKSKYKSIKWELKGISEKLQHLLLTVNQIFNFCLERGLVNNINCMLDDDYWCPVRNSDLADFVKSGICYSVDCKYHVKEEQVNE